MNKTTIIAVVATAYATAIAVSFSLGFVLGPRQAPIDDGYPGAVASSAPAPQSALTNSGLGDKPSVAANLGTGLTQRTPNAMVASAF
jgi:hypothetical protein